MIRKTMPIINKPLTNHELLTELQKRVKAGTIAWEVQTQANDTLSKLFDLKISSSNLNGEASNPSAGFNQSTLLWVALGVALLLLVWKRSYNLKVNLIDKQN